MRAALLEVQERAVEGGEAVAVGHASILARRAALRKCPLRADRYAAARAMPVLGATIDPWLGELLLAGRDGMAPDDWFDAHTHIGQNDPDGVKATAEEILEGLDVARQSRALLFAMHEPDGYPPANDAVLAACAASAGRLVPLARVAPNAEGALAEAERCLGAGARGFKLHPRSDAFGLPHPVVEQVVALAHEHRAPVLFHAGRGIPHLGEAVVDLARRYPGARLILAHAGITDLGWIAPQLTDLPNVFFDTAWWSIADLLQLYATVPPAHILYASDMPYGPGALTAFMFARCAEAVGLSGEARRAIAGAQLERVLDGTEPLDVGPAPGAAALGARVIEAERVVVTASAAVQVAFRGGDPTEPLALARSACRTARSDEVGQLLGTVDRALHLALEAHAAAPGDPRAIIPGTIVAVTLAGTPAVSVPTLASDAA
jgi:predicted TIM-barrel fold metal-dependent hydrolase